MDRAVFRQRVKKTLIIIHDWLATVCAGLAASYVCFDETEFTARLPVLFYLLPAFASYAVILYHYFRLYRSKWRFASLPDLSNIVQASVVLALSLLVLDYFLVSPRLYGSYFFGKKTIIIYGILQMCFLGGTRLLYRYFRYTHSQHALAGEDHLPTLLLGRASDIELVLRAIESGTVQRIQPKGALSYRNADFGQMIRGVPILGHFEDLERVILEFAERGVVIRRLVATPSALTPEAYPEQLLMRTRKLGLPLSRLSTLGEEARGIEILPLEIEDLLLRPTVDVDHKRLDAFIRGKRIIVTGGGGSIGSEVCARVAAFGAKDILVLENSEPSLNSILENPDLCKNGAHVTGAIADVRDRERIIQVVSEYRPDIIVHAAALKHVPYLEQDWEEGIKTNVFGTINVTDAAVIANVQVLVIISTDKAIDPVSMLGVTKRFSEMYAQARDADLWQNEEPETKPSQTRLVAVRFGNVLGSVGSVVPKFKAQIARGGPVTVTHPDMVRYFMTIREAVDLVLTAASHADREARMLDSSSDNRAAVYVLKMGQPVRIYELAERMIRFAGYEPNHDISIEVTGARPGERLNEILFASNEPLIQTGVDGVMAAKPVFANKSKLDTWLEQLQQAIHTSDRALAEQIFEEAIPEFKNRKAASAPALPTLSEKNEAVSTPAP